LSDSAKSIPGKLNELLDKKRKLYLVFLFILSVLLSMIETVGISVIMPFISVAANPDMIENAPFKLIYDFFGFVDKNSFILFFGIAIVVFYVCRSLYSIFYNYCMVRFSLGTYNHFASKIFKKYLEIPYKLYVYKNPSMMGQVVSSETNNLCQLLLNFLQIFAECITILLLYIFMVLVNFQITLVLTGLLAVILTTVFFTIIKASKRLGDKRYAASLRLGRTITETFRNYKFIKLKGNQETIYRNFQDSTSTISGVSITSSVLGSIPKNVLESLGFSLLVSTVCYIIVRYNTAAMVIPVISMYALALYRILPSINRLLGYFNNVAFLQKSLHIVYEELQIQTVDEGMQKIDFSNEIRADNVWFKYLKGNDVIRNISLSIKKGEKIAFTGESGSGKTTLVDILSGVYQPTQGAVLIDGIKLNDKNVVSWRSKIGYIPQDIYLFDGTVAENVSFGSDNNDEDKIIAALEKAQIWNFLEAKEGLNTIVGEGGIQLSGGQKQRIGIARALFSDPEILVLDEATSSLDNTTESEIMNEVYGISGDKTLIVIAHRLSTVEQCDRRIRIEDGVIVA
jgi:ATP-binding cassette subfamily B protein/ATP-binding cassette subfamily C protein